MAGVIFAIILFCEILLTLGLVVSIARPEMTLWPPPGKNSWQQHYMLTLTFMPMVLAIPLGFLDWNSFLWAHWSRYLIGAVLSVAGLWFALWGTRSLSLQASLGLKGEFIKTGPYRYSRNPQYVGWSAFFVGYVLLCNSVLILIVAAAGTVLFGLTPFTEEPWLRQRFGQKYDQYVAQVPRFAGIPKKTREHGT
jgi:protein-S-isoprenylcysteine O-methyltransferase Ste14